MARAYAAGIASSSTRIVDPMLAVAELTSGGRGPPVVMSLVEGLVDGVRQVGRTQPAGRDGEDRVEVLDHVDRTEQRAQFEVPAQVRERDVPEGLPRARAVHPRRLQRVAG